MYLTLPFLLSLVASYLVDGADKPALPDRAETLGLSDEDLWDRIVSDSDTLAGMSFEEAVRSDPRRIDARVQQAVLNTFFAAINVLGRTQNYGELMQHAYLVRMAGFRENGSITASELANALKEDWSYYSEILSVAFAMKSVQATQLQQALFDHRDAIFRGFREAHEVLETAGNMSTIDSDRQAWLQMDGVIRDMWNLVNSLTGKKSGQGTLDTDLFGALFRERFGSIHPSGEWEKYIVSGHRAPTHALPQFRRMGGRFYGGVQ